MGDFDRLKKNIFIINFHLHKKDGANMIQNFIQNNHGVSTVNHVTHGHINAGKNDILDPGLGPLANREYWAIDIWIIAKLLNLAILCGIASDVSKVANVFKTTGYTTFF